MKRKHCSDRELVSLLREYRADCLLAAEGRWAGEVPPETDRAADRAFRQMGALIAAGLPLAAASGAGKAVGAVTLKTVSRLSGGRLLALILAAAVAVSAGAGAAIPSVRESLRTAFTGAAVQGETQTGAMPAERAPRDYAIPAPGPEYTVRESASTDGLQYCWFTAGERAVLAEIARRLPEETGLPEDAEALSLGRLTGWYYLQDGAQYLLLRAGETYILLSMNHGTRSDLTAYAELLLRENP